jgi:hypothetical protein
MDVYDPLEAEVYKRVWTAAITMAVMVVLEALMSPSPLQRMLATLSSLW